MKLSVVVPVYNEKEGLAHSHERLLRIAAQENFRDIQHFELVYVNDGSRDGSDQILEGLKKSSARWDIKVLHFARNFGHSNAVLAGLQKATGDFIVIIDADLQDPPEILGDMYKELRAGFDVVYGQRLTREKESVFKKITAWGFYRILDAMTGVDIPKDTGDFRIMTREVCQALLECGEQEPFLRGLVAWVGFRQKAFPYHRQSRQFGSTKYPLKKMLRFAGLALLSFSNLPLQVAMYLSFLTFLGCLLLVVWALYVHFQGTTVPGWTSLVIAFLFGQSMTLFVIGVIGLYVGQVHTGVQNRPRFILRK